MSLNTVNSSRYGEMKKSFDQTSLDSEYLASLLPDCHDFRAICLSVSVPPDFYHLINKTILNLPLIRHLSDCNGKIYGNILREIVHLGFEQKSLLTKIGYLTNYLAGNTVSVWINYRDYFYLLERVPQLGYEIPIYNNYHDFTINYKEGYNYKIRVSESLPNQGIITVNSLLLHISGGIALDVMGESNDISTTLDDIRKKRLHLIPFSVDGEYKSFSHNASIGNLYYSKSNSKADHLILKGLLELLMEASDLYQNGWFTLNTEDIENVNNLLREIAQIMSYNGITISNRRAGRGTKIDKRQILTDQVYRLLLAVDPDLTYLMQHQDGNQIKMYFLIFVQQNDLINLDKLLSVVRREQVFYALEMAAEIGSLEIFVLLYRKFNRCIKTRNMRICWLTALYHSNLEVAKFIYSMESNTIIYTRLRITKYKCCWHADKENSPCRQASKQQIIREMISLRNRIIGSNP